MSQRILTPSDPCMGCGRTGVFYKSTPMRHDEAACIVSADARAAVNRFRIPADYEVGETVVCDLFVKGPLVTGKILEILSFAYIVQTREALPLTVTEDEIVGYPPPTDRSQLEAWLDG